MNAMMISSFSDELTKIAANVFVDPRTQEIEERRENPPARDKDVNREVLKEHLKNMAGIGLGAGLGVGGASLAAHGTEKLLDRYGKSMPKWAPRAMQAAIIPVGAMGAYAAHQAMRARSNERLEEARRRGLEAQRETQ